MGLAGEHDRSVADEALRMTDSLSLASRALQELSGGEAQRVMIARALAQQPVVVLLDEPTSHLDLRNQLRIYQMMRRVAHDWPMAVVCVSHDVNLAGRFADRLVVMKDGAVLAAGGPGEVIDGPTLSRAYDVEIELIPVEGQSTPIARAK
jgi:iron complex transport system ATP-binding protein